MSTHADIEKAGDDATFFLVNNSIQEFSWKDLTVTVKDRATKKPRELISDINGSVRQGELLALMGPSGCGKTTLLNVLARRAAASGAKVEGDCFINGSKLDTESFARITSYVEQEDALIGSLTVEETLKFAADLSLPGEISKSQRRERIETLLQALGIHNQAKTLVGTPIRKGISGGQKRRVSIASQLISCPRILFLDEPTSGLDSTASFEVISYAKKLAVANKLIIIASIHQPSTFTFQLFDKLLLLSGGQTCYFGPVTNVESYFSNIGFPVPAYTNPAEHILDLVSADFHNDVDKTKEIQRVWTRSVKDANNQELADLDESTARGGLQEQSSSRASTIPTEELVSPPRPGLLRIAISLLHRSWIKSYRDIVAYGIRIVMYLGLAVMMGTVWLRLSTSQESIQPFINAIFFGSAFMSFMAVAYVPAFLEDRATYIKERANGLYGPTPFIIANFLIGLPFLFLISILFSIVSYWLSNFQPTAKAFFTWVMWLFLDLVAAESLVVLVSSIFPIFVISLALVAFVNGLWMSVGGFLVSSTILNPFWKYVFHYIDYQAYVFQGMMINEFKDRIYACGPHCQCMYRTDLAPKCQIRGTGVLATYGYSADTNTGKWVGILVGIIAVYRLFAWMVLYVRRT